MNNDHPEVSFGKTGVLLINLGTPDSTSWFDIRKYLKEFLSDKRVIEVNPFLWQIILNAIILNLRPSKTAKAYKEIWMKKENMSPLRYYTIMQTKKLPMVSTKKTIGDTIKIITKGSLGVAVVTKAAYKVAGYVTDGQIRKSKFSKKESIMKISTKKPIYVSENTLV